MIKQSLLVVVFCMLSNMLLADTIPGGNVSGTWYAANSPYYIIGNITIPADDTLTIEPAVQVKFFPTYILLVNGILEAVGNESDSIHFSPDLSTAYWRGIRFSNAPDNSYLDYCSISGVGGLVATPILCENNSDPIISHCRITGTAGTAYPDIWVTDYSNPSISDCVILGGIHGIRWYSGASNPMISGCTISSCTRSAVLKEWGNLTMIDCTIIANTSLDYSGAGIRSLYQNLTLINCTISNNDSPHHAGGGIYCKYGSHTLINCTINGNSCECTGDPLIGGGGVCFDTANASLSYCSIYNNSSMPDGGRITFNGTGSLTIDHCTIDGNGPRIGTYLLGSGMWLRGSPTTNIANSILSHNLGYGIHNQGTLAVEYTDFYGNDSGAIYGNVPSDFGVLDTVNYNGDSCDCYFNIFLDPMYVNQPEHNYHLTENSSCIDAGDPTFAYDPDSTITDMGAFWYDQTGTAEYRPVKHVNDFDFIGPTIFKGPICLPEGKICKVLDITGRVVSPDRIKPGIYFIEVDGKIEQKIIRIR
jgi:parallel beta-helix repeat protein